jgi:imidazolonepropionase
MLVVEQGRIAAILPQGQLNPASFDGEVVDAAGRWITPGFIDCHTHLVYGGNRAAEWEQRLLGVPYQQIAAQGGGIVSTVRATRALNEAQLAAASLPRLQALMAEGVTTLESKSGYGLNLDDEIKQLRVARQLADSQPVEIAPTLLSAHACRRNLPAMPMAISSMSSATFCPAWQNRPGRSGGCVLRKRGFSPAQTRRVFEAAQQHGLRVKGHVEQLSNLQVRSTGGRIWRPVRRPYRIPGRGRCGSHARGRHGGGAAARCLLLLARNPKPPVELLRAAGVPMAVSTDLNPGTSPFASIRLAMNQACVLFGLSPEEALAGTTRHAAQALGRGHSHGKLALDHVADLLLWDIEHPAEIVYGLGVNLLAERVFRGQRPGKETTQ